jgi:xanthine dehydrogenase small subunit
MPQKSRKVGAATIRFWLDGELVELTDADPTRTVLQFLREDRQRIGTKEGCAEGDCGACTVVVAEAAASGGLKLRAVNSCIQFLATLDGKQLFTVESLQRPDGGLHPVQQAIVDCHGSQCGFCTPGFVMSLFALFKNAATPDRRDIDNALAGNLCRCTGYKPIIEAASRMYEYAGSEPARWLDRPNTSNELPGDEEQGLAASLQEISRDVALHLEAGGRHFFAPRSIDELAALVAEFPEATLLAGGTDIGLWVTKQHRQLDALIYTGQVGALKRVVRSDSYVEIGAAVTITDAVPVIVDEYPELQELFLRFASPPIRNAATLGGNISNGSPIGDSMPPLLALGATLMLRKGEQTREVSLESFYLDYQKTALAAGEFVESLRLPKRTSNMRLACYKISKRFDQDISALCGAFMIELDGAKVADIRIAYGGMAATPKRAKHCEAAILGAEWSEQTVSAAQRMLDQDFVPISDMRASDEYRRTVCKNLLLRFFAETTSATVSVYDYGR